MLKLFGPASAEQVDGMGDEYLETCRAKVSLLLGEDVAKQFDVL